MTDPIRESIQSFHAALEKANRELQRSTAKVEDRKEQILSLLKSEIRLPEPPKGSGGYQDACREALSETSRRITQWQSTIEQRVARSEFVNRHEKSILVIAFADVKAGKSSLGNFTAGYYLQNTPYADLYQPIIYTIEDFSQASTEDRARRSRPLPFPEDEIEATSAIQYYTLHQGLTWVDTPGLHSLTKEHGALANEYVQFADLVLFLTSSNSPLKEDERDELSRLLVQNKPVMVVITKSDATQTVVRDGKLANETRAKSPENRKAQDDYVMGEIAALGSGTIENHRVVSTSVKLAREALAQGDGVKFHESNLDTFFSQMSGILSVKAMELKMRRPVSEVNHCIDQLIGNGEAGTIAGERARLRGYLEELERLYQERSGIEKRIVSELEAILPTALSASLRTLRERGLLSDQKQVQEAAIDCLSTISTTQCILSFQEKFQMNQITLLNMPELAIGEDAGNGYQQTEMERVYTTMEPRAPKGIIEHIHSIIDPDKKFFQARAHTETIQIGDNFESFVQQMWETARPGVAQYVAQTVDGLYDQCIAPLRERYMCLDEQFESLTQKLRQLKFKEGERV